MIIMKRPEGTLRLSNYELLRCICMVMIIGLHYFGMGGALGNLPQGHGNLYLTKALESVFIMGVNGFVLISGYFMVTSKTGHIRKAVNYYCITVIYDAVLYCISAATGALAFSWKLLASAFLPFFVGRRWFVESYIILLLLAPFLNLLLRSLSKRNYQILLALELLIFSFWYSFLPSPPILDDGYGIINFIVVYTIAGYLRLHGGDRRLNPWGCAGVFLLCAAAIFGFCFTPFQSRAWGYSFLFNIIGACALFLAFHNLSMRTNRVVNLLGRHTFGVYVLHSSFAGITLLYQSILHCSQFWQSPFFFIHMLISIIAVFMACSAVDILGEKAFRRVLYPLLDKIKICNLSYTVPS